MKPIPGSGKSVALGARDQGSVDPGAIITVLVIVAPKEPLPRSATVGAPRTMSHREFAERHGADPGDVAKVAQFANQNRLTIKEANLAERTVVLEGKSADMARAFGVELRMYVTPDGRRYRGRVGEIFVPDDLSSIVNAVLGLDDRPAARPHYRRLGDMQSQSGPQLSFVSSAPAISKRPFTAVEVARLYGFPRSFHGEGQCIAMIELGGGYSSPDMLRYFSHLGIEQPKLVWVGVDGATNRPGVDPGADGEVQLDIQIAGTIAPSATIAVYFTSNTDSGFLAAVKRAVHDQVRKPSVVSISWGAPEESWTDQAMQQLDQTFQEAAALNVTICCASGDDGSADMKPSDWDRRPHVDFPSSSPNALACGGTQLLASNAGTVAGEQVWNEGARGGAGGGGVSDVFSRPAYQSGAEIPGAPAAKGGRGVPDVAANADPETGYRVLINGSPEVIGGTSAVAPLYAGLIALVNQARAEGGQRAAGFINASLYASVGAFRDITTGNNDIYGESHKYSAGRGWDACTGLGSPVGRVWIALFTASKAQLEPRRDPPQWQV